MCGKMVVYGTVSFRLQMIDMKELGSLDRTALIPRAWSIALYNTQREE